MAGVGSLSGFPPRPARLGRTGPGSPHVGPRRTQRCDAVGRAPRWRSGHRERHPAPLRFTSSRARGGRAAFRGEADRGAAPPFAGASPGRRLARSAQDAGAATMTGDAEPAPDASTLGGPRTAAPAARCGAWARATGGGGERMAEVGRLLHPEDRDRLLAAIPPAYPRVVARQVALEGGEPRTSRCRSRRKVSWWAWRTTARGCRRWWSERTPPRPAGAEDAPLRAAAGPACRPASAAGLTGAGGSAPRRSRTARARAAACAVRR